MKKVVLIFLVMFSIPAWAQRLDTLLYRSMDTLSKAYLAQYPQLGMKAGLVILHIEEKSRLAASNRLGSTVEAYLREMIGRSLVYELVDRANLESLLREMELSLTGMVYPSDIVEIGNLAGVKAFLWGDISETRDRFLISLNVTDAETGLVLGTSSFEIDQRTLVKTADELQYSYVAPNGIGLTAHLFYPVYMLSDIYNKSVLPFGDLGLAYRFTRNFMVSVGFLSAPEYTGEQYRWDKDISLSSVQPLLNSTPDDWGRIPDQDLVASQWTAQFRAAFFRLDAQYTFNFNPKFNIGLSGGVFNAISNVRMYVDIGGDSSGPYYRKQLATDDDPPSYFQQPFMDTASVEYLFMDQFLPGVKTELRPEFFITPRIALSARIGFLWMKPLTVREIHASYASWWYYQKGKDATSWIYDPAYAPGEYSWDNIDAGEQRASWIYYGWNPLLRPDGKYWLYDLSGVYAQVGVSFFF